MDAVGPRPLSCCRGTECSKSLQQLAAGKIWFHRLGRTVVVEKHVEDGSGRDLHLFRRRFVAGAAAFVENVTDSLDTFFHAMPGFLRRLSRIIGRLLGHIAGPPLL